MSYETEAARIGGEPVTLVELDFDTCALTYGQAPCTASGAAGSECYNTFQTCQDVQNFDMGQISLCFWPVDVCPVLGVKAYSCLRSVKVTPTRIEPDRGLGVRGTVTVELQDFTDSDRGVDPYIATRTHDTARGTFFGKFRARNSQSLYGRRIRIRRGFLDPVDRSVKPENFIESLYIVEDFEGPDARGRIKIKGVDPLKRMNDALAPETTTAELDADIDAVVTQMRVVDPDGQMNAPDGTVRIGSELIMYSSVTPESGTDVVVLGSLTRGAFGSEASEHSAEDAVQSCLVYAAQKPVDVLVDLVDRVQGLSQFVNASEWEDEQDLWIPSTTISNVISKPTKVRDLVSDITQQTGLFVWFDDRGQKVQLRVIAPPQDNETPVRIDDFGGLIAGSFKLKEDLKEQVTRVFIYYGRNNLTEKGEPKHYRNVRITVAFDAESVNAFDREKPLEIFADWLDDPEVAERLGYFILSRFETGNRQFTFEVDQKEAGVWAGDLITLDTQFLQSVSGANAPETVRVVSVDADTTGVLKFEAIRSVFQTGANPDDRIAIWQGDEVSAHYDNATIEERQRGFYADDAGEVVPGVPAYKYF